MNGMLWGPGRARFEARTPTTDDASPLSDGVEAARQEPRVPLDRERTVNRGGDRHGRDAPG
jgi:hypothetical protein